MVLADPMPTRNLTLDALLFENSSKAKASAFHDANDRSHTQPSPAATL